MKAGGIILKKNDSPAFFQSRLTDAVSVILSELLSYEHPPKVRGHFLQAHAGEGGAGQEVCKAVGGGVARGAVTLDPYRAQPRVVVAHQRPVEGVEAVGRDEVGAGAVTGYQQRVVKPPVRAAELDKVAYLQLVDVRVPAPGAAALVGGEEVVEILHARPGGRPVVGAVVVPAEGLPAVHRAAAGEDALGDEVRAVPADAREVVEKRISPVGPAARVLAGAAAVVFPLLEHKKSPHGIIRREARLAVSGGAAPARRGARAASRAWPRGISWPRPPG